MDINRAEMKRKKPSLHFLQICDDIRQEANNKISLMGLFLTNEIHLSIPGILVKLCFHLYLKDVKQDDTFKMVLTDPDGEDVIGFVPDKIDFPPEVKEGNCAIALIATGIRITKSGQYNFKVYSPTDGKAIGERSVIFKNLKDVK